MELIFIFILPLLFVLCNVSIENTFVYDNEGNYQTAERSISYTPIAYTTKTITTTTTSFDHYTTWNLNNYTGDIYMAYDDFVYNVSFDGYMLAWNGSDKENISIYLPDYTMIIFNDEAYYQYHEEDCTIVTIEGVDYFKVSVSNFTYVIPDEEWEFNRGYYLYTETTETTTQDSPIIQLKNILADVIQIDSTNATYNVVFDYTCLWFIMFIIWHLVYMFVDFLLHFWRKEEK